MTLPRVHQVLQILYPTNWAGEDDLERGARLHFCMEQWVNAIKAASPVKPLLDEYNETEQVRLGKAMEWVVQETEPPWHCEELSRHSLGFCGHPDLNALYRQKLWVIDYKFAETITEQNLMQGEAYRHLVRGCQGVILLQITNKADVKVHKLKQRPDLWAIFLNALAVWKWRNR